MASDSVSISISGTSSKSNIIINSKGAQISNNKEIRNEIVDLVKNALKQMGLYSDYNFTNPVSITPAAYRGIEMGAEANSIFTETTYISPEYPTFLGTLAYSAESNGKIIAVYKSSPQWIIDHYVSYGMGDVLESLEQWYNIIIFDTATKTKQSFQILVNAKPAPAFADLKNTWYSPDFFEKVIVIPTSGRRSNIFAAKRNTLTVPASLVPPVTLLQSKQAALAAIGKMCASGSNSAVPTPTITNTNVQLAHPYTSVISSSKVFAFADGTFFYTLDPVNGTAVGTLFGNVVESANVFSTVKQDGFIYLIAEDTGTTGGTFTLGVFDSTPAAGLEISHYLIFRIPENLSKIDVCRVYFDMPLPLNNNYTSYITAFDYYLQWLHLGISNENIFGGGFILPNSADLRFKGLAEELGLLTIAGDPAALLTIETDLITSRIFKGVHCAGVLLQTLT